MKKTFLVAVAAALLVGMTLGPAMAAVYKVGDIVTDEEMVVLYEGEKSVPLKEVLKDGKTMTVLTFMQSACAACQAEMNYLLQVKEKNKDLQICAVAVDMQGKPAVDRYLQSFPGMGAMKYLLDPQFALAKRFRFSSTPSMVILDKSGKVLLRHMGWDPTDIKDVEELLK